MYYSKQVYIPFCLLLYITRRGITRSLSKNFSRFSFFGIFSVTFWHTREVNELWFRFSLPPIVIDGDIKDNWERERKFERSWGEEFLTNKTVDFLNNFIRLTADFVVFSCAMLNICDRPIGNPCCPLFEIRFPVNIPFAPLDLLRV